MIYILFIVRMRATDLQKRVIIIYYHGIRKNTALTNMLNSDKLFDQKIEGSWANIIASSLCLTSEASWGRFKPCRPTAVFEVIDNAVNRAYICNPPPWKYD